MVWLLKIIKYNIRILFKFFFYIGDYFKSRSCFIVEGVLELLYEIKKMIEIYVCYG